MMKKSNPSRKTLDNFPNIIYRRGASGFLSPVLRNTGIRVQTIVIASQKMTISEIAKDYDLTEIQVKEALKFYDINHEEIDTNIQVESTLARSASNSARWLNDWRT